MERRIKPAEMKEWLEKNFPSTKYASAKIAFSRTVIGPFNQALKTKTPKINDFRGSPLPLLDLDQRPMKTRIHIQGNDWGPDARVVKNSARVLNTIDITARGNAEAYLKAMLYLT